VMYLEPVAPMQFQPKLPRDLQTICLKCLQKAPGDRYASALDLAEDLRRFLAGEPIVARPTGIWERGLKWARRRPAVAALILVSSSATLALVVGVFVHNAQLREALETANRERARADGNLDKAREAVDAMLTNVGEKQLAKVPQMESVRRILLEKALQFYQGFLRENSADPAVMRETAWAYDRVADIHEKLGRHDQAEQALQGALALQVQLTERFPDEPAHRREQAVIFENLGNLYRKMNRPAQAEVSYQEALDIREQLAREHPNSDAYQHDLAMGHLNLGGLCGERGQLNLAETHLQQALAGWERLHRDHPEEPNYENQLAKCQTNLGNLYAVTNRLGEAEASYLKGLTALDHLATTHPSVPECQNLLANGYNSLGLVLSGQRPDEAKSAYQKALEIHERLTRDHPETFHFAVDQGMTCTNMANLVKDMGEPQAALDWYAQALEILERLFRQQPKDASARLSLRNAYLGRAEAFAKLARRSEAIQDWDRALATDDGSGRGLLRLARAGFLARLGEHAQATAEAQTLADGAPASGELLYDLACVYSLSVAAARRDTKLAPADRERQADQYAARVLEMLTKAEAAGFFKNLAAIEHLKKDADLVPISARDDFKNWLAALESKTNPRDR
jgi:tetratricopeptide (TPR) repeat protein